MDKYHTRRAILEVMVAAEPAPVDPDDVWAHPLLQMAKSPQAVVVNELRGLAERGYVRNLKPGRTPLYRITGVGRGQLDGEDRRDEYVWGEWASEFQV